MGYGRDAEEQVWDDNMGTPSSLFSFFAVQLMYLSGCCTFSMWHSVALGWGTTAALGLCFKSMSRERSLSRHQRNLNFTRTTLYICTCSHALSPAGALSTSHPPFRPADPLRQPLLRSSPTSCSRSRAYNDRSKCLSRDCCRVFGSCFVRILSRALPTTAVQAQYSRVRRNL